MAQNLDKIEEEDAKLAAQEADNIRLAKRLKRYYGDPESNDPGFFGREGKDAVLDAQILANDLDAIDAEAAAMLKGKPRAMQLFGELTTKRNMDDMPKVSQHVFKERNKHADAVDADAFDLAIDNASNSTDPAIIEENIATAGNIAVSMAMRKGMRENNQLAQARQSGIGKAVAAVAERLSLQSPSEAQAFVALHAKDMDPQDVDKLLGALAPSAAKEEAGQGIGSYLVVKGSPEASTTPPAGGGSYYEGSTPMPDEAALDAAQFTGPRAQEGAASHTNARGELIRSPAGAKGVTQVMPHTAVDPGYGVKPIQNNSRAEYLRFGREYRAALLKEYDGNVVLALTAYNWGPGRVNEHLRKVGDPRQGQISDAQWVASIPVKEAREYAPSILQKVGTPISGSANAYAAPVVAQGVEVDLDATYEKIEVDRRAGKLTFIQAEALKDEATRRHSLGRQVKAEAEDALKEEVADVLNSLPVDGFDSYDKLPLNIRQRLAAHPELELTYRKQAQTNWETKQARVEAADNEARAEKAEKADFDVQDIRLETPEVFLSIDFRTQFPELTTADRMKWRNAQEEMRNQRSGKDAKGPNYEETRKYVNRYFEEYQTFGTKKPDADPETKRLRNAAYDMALRLEAAAIRRNGGKPISDAERASIARQVAMPVKLEVKGALWGTKEGGTIPRGALAAEQRRRGSRITGATMNRREAVRAKLEGILRRPVSDEEVDRDIAEYEEAQRIIGQNRGSR